MKKIEVKVALGLVMFTFFCSFFWSSIPESSKIAFRVARKIGNRFEKKYGLYFAGISEAASKGKYDYIGFELFSYRLLTKDEGRVLLLKCAEDVLRAINSCPKLKPHLKDYPFTGDNIIVNIYVQPRKNPDVYHPNVAVFSFYNEKLFYTSYFSKSKRNWSDYKEEVETYEEAKEIVAAQNAQKKE